ncbi:protein FAM104A [Chanos chanos]|uniref:Protein FAM104A n=1 Tax=Chanos chanos TaxID=29144 RepID=A0A6J2WQE6_CHACN|nr:protein FAM104A [Chanos chanos]
MLTENRKRQRCQGDEEDGQLMPRAKRSSTGHLPSEVGRDAWDSESSSSDSSGISSPEHVAGGSNSSSQCAVDNMGALNAHSPCSPLNTTQSTEQSGPMSLVSYHQINRVLREAHFHSLQSRGQSRDR